MSSHKEREEKIAKKWAEEKTFKKSVEKESPKGEFVFYDGPPFATGTPHYGHILASTIKDVIPRWKTMQGYRVRRRWGWDCHGLPVENLIEKELGLKSKKDIVSYGVEKFNQASKASVMRFADEWRTLIPKMGRWVDMDDDYRTMDPRYTESVWWAFARLYEKGLIYEGFKVMQLCPHCETTLSNFEVAQGYRDITDISVYAKFELADDPGTYLVAWTTTPWTLPGNVALAVSSNDEYVKIEVGGQRYVMAQSRVSAVKETEGHKVLGTMKGSALVGKSYKPVFDYYSKNTKLDGYKNGWKVYGADFVTMDSGTGIVHIAPAFGADDYELLKKYNLPLVQHVATDGTFKDEVVDLKGIKVKPRNEAGEKDAHQRADVEVIKYLAHKGLLFAKEKIIHSYPHCWRCETPLLNYASSSWFVKVSGMRDDLVRANKKVSWVPEEIGEGRFGNWLRDARDWAISRSRFWGAPIPVWKNEKTGKCTVISSVDDFKKYSKAKNTYYVMRHGEAENNVKGIVSSTATTAHHLTENGKRQAIEASKKIQADIIYVSPFVRTRETADIVAKAIGLASDKVVVDERLREINAGVFNGKDIREFHAFFKGKNRFVERPEGGENYTDIKIRTGNFIYDMEKKHEGKKILIVTHDSPAWLLFASACGCEPETAVDMRGETEYFINNAEVRKLDFSPMPHDREYTLDLHRPYIDEIELRDGDGSKMVRVPEVFDCWFESGSMPFAEACYPRYRDDFNPNVGIAGAVKRALGVRGRGYPADFIAEGLDQTRGWFYSMLVLGVALFGESPYKRVIVNGLILAEDGQKMSKSKKNFPDPTLLIDKYGADALRFYMLSSPVVKGQDLRFLEKGVDEVAKKHIGRLLNVVSFYKMYAGAKSTKSVGGAKSAESTNPLDIWIMARLRGTVSGVSKALESYELDKATRPIEDFIDDLSTWYIRRSRDRFKDIESDGDRGGQGRNDGDTNGALSTTREVLEVFAKVIAPFMPFVAEEIYMEIGGDRDEDSVHLSEWPERSYMVERGDGKIVTEMKKVRDIASLCLEARSMQKINVRQPLQKATIYTKEDKDIISGAGLIDILKDEINVKDIDWKKGDTNMRVELDTVLTPELRDEGVVREVVRAIQDFRKKSSLKVEQKISIILPLDAETRDIVTRNETEIKKVTGLTSIDYVEGVAGDMTGIKIK